MQRADVVAVAAAEARNQVRRLARRRDVAHLVDHDEGGCVAGRRAREAALVAAGQLTATCRRAGELRAACAAVEAWVIGRQLGVPQVECRRP